LKVFRKKLNGVGAVGVNAANFGSCDHNRVGLFLGKKFEDSFAIQKIQFGSRFTNPSVITFGLNGSNYG
jgi:hypothetical protein